MAQRERVAAQATPTTRIAIAGPGRSGTTLLVRLFAEWGFTVPPLEGNWHEQAHAGLESRIGQDSGFEVDKDPWAYEYLDRIPASQLAQYQALLVPIRDRQDAAISRSVQERASRAQDSPDDHWLWDSWGTVPGGAVSRTNIDAIANTLASGLWDLLATATAAGLTPMLVNFPRFVYDFDYLWDQVGPLIQERQTKESAFAAWERVVDPSRVRIGGTDRQREPDVGNRELQGVIEILRVENRKALAQRDEALAQRDEALAQRDEALAQRDEALADPRPPQASTRFRSWRRREKH